MKRDLTRSKKCSRREFTKSAAALLASTPFASSAVGRGVEEPVKYSLSNPEQQKPLKAQFTDHIPPIVIADGSFSIESGHEIKFVNAGGPSVRPHVYTAAGVEPEKEYGDIASVEVVTEFEEHFTIDRIVFPPSYNPQLMIWLQDTPLSGPAAANANILIRGKHLQANVKTLRVEMKDKKFGGTRRIEKKRRTHRCEHDDNPNPAKKFRIRKWQLVDAGGSPIPHHGFEDDAVNSGATKYMLMVSFYET